MSSDLEKIAKGLVELASDGGGVASAVHGASGAVKRMSDAVQAHARTGLPVQRLLSELQDAAGKTQKAAASVKQVQAEGKAFAAHPAKSGGGGGTGRSALQVGKDFIEAVAVGVLISSPATFAAEAAARVNDLDPVDRGPVSGYQIFAEVADAHADRTNDLDDVDRAYKQRAEDKVDEPEASDRRPSP
ncbi:hypothetical protein RCF27_07030 [Rhodococcus pyridinivorans]|uniref:Uncharacterized protein n=1 Tax=Rhodococcus pyridinivorans TaxID=103816 RepID=A0A7M2XT90_9NOCA|nr:hypothetical protein [Rhodococcus pyridinivorans]QOW00151.1 hypothetical protein INP59_07320 [Rhodococcus pyridinivorans]WMM74049.1 hypothetical protein RCF27_07030 [Rhodococcus pyridinivorans]